MLQGGGAQAACAAPEVTVSPSPVVVGESAELRVINLSTTCNDQGEGADTPATGVVVSLAAQDGSWGPSEVATLDAAADFTATATILLPSDTVPGAVLVSLDGVETGGFEVIAGTPSLSPEPSAEPSPASGPGDDVAMDLVTTFNAMIVAMAADGEAGLRPFLEYSDSGDLWGISNWTWAPGECFEGEPGESGCVGTFEKDGATLETVFLFDQIDGQWLLTDSWVDGEGGS